MLRWPHNHRAQLRPEIEGHEAAGKRVREIGRVCRPSAACLSPSSLRWAAAMQPGSAVSSANRSRIRAAITASSAAISSGASAETP